MLTAKPIALRLEQGSDADPRPTLIAPSTRGFIHIAAEVDPPSRSGPILRRGRAVRELLRVLAYFGERVLEHDAVESVQVFDAIAFPPDSALLLPGTAPADVPRYDVAALIETTSPAAAGRVARERCFAHLLDPLESQAARTHVMLARNVRRIADVPADGGVYMFNYFAAGDQRSAIELWELIAGFYQAEMSLDNSVLLAPLGGIPSDYVAINHTCWQLSLPQLVARQLAQSTFVSRVLAELDRRRVGCLPYAYRRI